MSKESYLVACDNCGRLDIELYYEDDNYYIGDSIGVNFERENDYKKKCCACCGTSASDRIRVRGLDDYTRPQLMKLGYLEQNINNQHQLLKFTALLNIKMLKFLNSEAWDQDFTEKLFKAHGNKVYAFMEQK